MRYSSEKSERPQKEKPLVALIYPEIDEECGADGWLKDTEEVLAETQKDLINRDRVSCITLLAHRIQDKINHLDAIMNVPYFYRKSIESEGKGFIRGSKFTTMLCG